MQRNTHTKSTTTANDQYLGKTIVVGDRVPFSGQAECDSLPREKPSSLPPWGCVAFATKLEHPTVRRGSLDPHRSARNFCRLEQEGAVRVRLCKSVDTLFPLFGNAGTKPAS